MDEAKIQAEYEALANASIDEKYAYEKNVIVPIMIKILDETSKVPYGEPTKPLRIHYAILVLKIIKYLKSTLLKSPSYFRANVFKLNEFRRDKAFHAFPEFEEAVKDSENILNEIIQTKMLTNPVYKLAMEGNVEELQKILPQVKTEVEKDITLLLIFLNGSDDMFDILLKSGYLAMKDRLRRKQDTRLILENFDIHIVTKNVLRERFWKIIKPAFNIQRGEYITAIWENLLKDDVSEETVSFMLDAFKEDFESYNHIHALINFRYTNNRRRMKINKFLLDIAITKKIPIISSTNQPFKTNAEWLFENDKDKLDDYFSMVSDCENMISGNLEPKELYTLYINYVIKRGCYKSVSLLKKVIDHGQVEALDSLLKTGHFNEYLEDIYKTLTNPDMQVVFNKYMKLEMWEGWSRADAAQFDFLFSDEGAINHSVCPVCLKYVERSDGCLYMSHDCAALSGFYHNELYNKYTWSLDDNDENDDDNNQRGGAAKKITWCTDCGRICYGHQHYELNAVTATTKPKLLPHGDPFEKDCRLTNGGGGYPEKVARYRRMREYALELQEDIGAITRKAALKDLVEQMWNAPLYKTRAVQRIVRNKAWNIPSTAFPLPPNTTTTNTEANAPNLPFDGELPILHPAETANFSNALFIDDANILQFQHKMANGAWNRHTGHGQQISREAFRGFLRDVLGNPAALGYCWQYATDEQMRAMSNAQKATVCTARLHPAEVQAALDMSDEGDKKLYDAYRKQYNRKFIGQ